MEDSRPQGTVLELNFKHSFVKEIVPVGADQLPKLRAGLCQGRELVKRMPIGHCAGNGISRQNILEVPFGPAAQSQCPAGNAAAQELGKHAVLSQAIVRLYRWEGECVKRHDARVPNSHLKSTWL